ncbi:hypothetical protein ElyMa_006375700 [Elysia marginata]|uniref:Guanylate cyclase domain-containing protein n=1 Tax=Elysia marginata TaxID=1093978 RepID=A0AAV4HR62_9GAST|nr:hypothetical protein ElyMa_006375700 [Elysia marginata]
MDSTKTTGETSRNLEAQVDAVLTYLPFDSTYGLIPRQTTEPNKGAQAMRTSLEAANPSTFNSISTIGTDDEAPPGWTEVRVQQIMDSGLTPLRSDMEEMKKSLARMEKLLQVLVNEKGSSPELQSQRILQQQSPVKSLGKDLPSRDGKPKSPSPIQETQPENPGVMVLPREESKTGTRKVTSAYQGDEEQTNVKVTVTSPKPKQHRQREEEADLQDQLTWFKERVNHLQGELNILRNRQEEILSTVKAHCDFTQRVVRDQEIRNTEEPEEETKQTKETRVEDVATTREMMEMFVENIQALTIGQSQRVIDNIRNPSTPTENVFHFYLSHFQQLVRTKEIVQSRAWALHFTDSFLIVRGVASFSAENDQMTLGLERMMDTQELGLEQGNVSNICVKARIKADGTQAMSDIELGELAMNCGKNSLQFEGKVVHCQELVDSGYDSYKEGSLLVEFEITANADQHLMYSVLIGRLSDYLRQRTQ